MPEFHPGTSVEILDSAPTSLFRNAIPNTKRYMRLNQKTVQDVSTAAYTGDFDALEVLLATGDESNLFNGDLNMHVTSLTAIHMAATAGQTECVELLLKAKADPHVRERAPYGRDPEDGKTAFQMAQERGWDDTAELLEAAARSHPYGFYVPGGPQNNAKVNDGWEWGKEPDRAWYNSRPGAARLQGLDPRRYGSSACAVTESDSDDELEMAIAAAPRAKPLPIGLLFPGQGSVYVKMLCTVKDLPPVKEMFEQAREILGFDVLDLCMRGPEPELEKASNSQPVMFIAGLAALHKLSIDRSEAVTRCQCMAGLSIGEYTALCAAGVITFEDGLRLAKLRGEAVQEAEDTGKQLQMTIAGFDKTKVMALCAEAQKSEGGAAVCEIAHEFFPKGFQCAGSEAAVQKLKQLADKAGALQAKLQRGTGGATHTSLMKPAQKAMSKALDELLPKMNPPTKTIYMNVNAQPVRPGTNPKDIVDILKQQIVSPVLWESSVRAMIKDGVSEFYETGPMKQLKAMMKRIDSKVWAQTVNVEI